MKRLILLFLLIPLLCFSQQVNHTWGYTTAGVAYNQSGVSDVDSITTTNIIFDLQDWYPMDYLPVASDDSVIILNSTRFYIGTFWYKIDVEADTDSSSININAYPGFMDYYPGSGIRITAANIDYSTTATAISNTGTYTTGDVQWTAVNVYLSNSEGKILPPEFLKIEISWDSASNDDIDFYWNLVYIGVYQSEQEKRSTTNDGNAKKAEETLH